MCIAGCAGGWLTILCALVFTNPTPTSLPAATQPATSDKLVAAADGGSVKAMLELGRLYHKGGDAAHPKDDRESLKWYLKAAGTGDVTAMDWVGYLYVQGTDGKP